MTKQIFVVGSSRSGTTMMGRILGSHEKLFTFYETHFFEQLWDPTSDNQELSIEQAEKLGAKLIAIQNNGYYTQDNPKRYLSEAREALRETQQPLTAVNVYTQILEHITTLNGKVISCDQTPRNIFYLQTILDLLPDAKVIVMVRDPRDVMLSQKQKWKRSSLSITKIPHWQLIRFWANYHPVTMGILWNSALKAALPFVDHPQVYFQSFEKLIAEPETQLKQMCSFLGLSFLDEMLDIPQVGSSHQRDTDGTGIIKSASGRWQQQLNERTEVVVCERITQKYMARFGYKASGWHANPIHILWIVIIWPVKMVLAFLLNVRRVRNLRLAVEKRLGLTLDFRRITN